MSIEMIRANCVHCGNEYMTDRFSIEHYCEPCTEPYLIKDYVMVKGLYFKAAGGGITSQPANALVVKKAEALAYRDLRGENNCEISPLSDHIGLNEIEAQLANLAKMREFLAKEKNSENNI